MLLEPVASMMAEVFLSEPCSAMAAAAAPVLPMGRFATEETPAPIP
jgi:hypothetical protein